MLALRNVEDGFDERDHSHLHSSWLRSVPRRFCVVDTGEGKASPATDNHRPHSPFHLCFV